MDPKHTEAVDAIVELIASYAGENGPNFCSLFSDDKYASVCFPGVVLDVPESIVAEIDAACRTLRPYLVGYSNVTYMSPDFLFYPYLLTGSRP